MQLGNSLKRIGAVSLAAAAAILLTGCLLSPGKFTSQLELKNGGTFAYSYEGEIYLLALSQLAEMGNKTESADAEFMELPCYSDDEFEERPCTADDIAEQKRSWEAEREDRNKRQKQEAEMMGAVLGGIDPADPGAAEELANRLRRQKGWKAVEYKGGGLFLVEFRIEGRLDHDFQFPTIERFPRSNYFVQVANLNDGTVRVDAPGFSVQSGGNPYQGMIAGMAELSPNSGNQDGGEQIPIIPKLDGTFRIVTDGEILANNTDEGPHQSTAVKILEWKVNKWTTAAPTALIKFSQ